MAHGLLIRLHHEQGVPVLVVRGELDFSAADQLRQQGRELVDAALDPAPPSSPQAATAQGAPEVAAAAVPVVVVDASEITFVDSAGLGALVTLLKRTLALRAGFSIAGAGQPLRTRLATTGLDMVVALHASVDEAVGAAVGTEVDTAVDTAGGRPGPPQGRPPIGGRRSGERTGGG